MPRKVQIVIEVDETRGTAAVKKVQSAISDMGMKVRVVGSEGTRSMQQFTNQGLLTAVLGANLLEQAVTRLAGHLKDATFGSTLLAARSEVLDTVMAQLAKTTGNSARVMRAQQRQMEALGIDTIRAQEALVKFTTAELSTADAVKIANVARNRAQISGEDTSATMERLTRSILAQEVELLKLAGIVVRQDDAFKRYAATLGKSAKDLNEVERRQAFVNEILRFARNDVGLYEAAWEKAGKRLLSIPRLARQAGISLGKNFQNDLALGVDAILQFLKFIEENGTAIATTTKAVVTLTAAYVALRIAMLDRSDTADVSVGESTAVAVIIAASDSLSVAAAEAVGDLSVALSRLDDLDAAAAEGVASITATLSRTEVLDLSLDEAAALLNLVSVADAAGLDAVEASQLAAAIDTGETLSLTASESAADILAKLARSDSVELSMDEARSVLASLSSTDTVAMAATDTAVVFILGTGSPDTKVILVLDRAEARRSGCFRPPGGPSCLRLRGEAGLMATRFPIKTGDTKPPIKASFVDPKGQPVDLGPATGVTLVIGGLTLGGTVTVTDAPNGKAQYDWVAADTAAAGIFKGEFRITWPDGTQTIPNNGTFDVEIQVKQT